MANDGEALARVLTYYNFEISLSSNKQKIICPFHTDENPSMIVNLDDGSWFCFGCNLSGDAYKFVYLLEKQNREINDLQAYKKYLEIINSSDFSEIKILAKKKTKKESKEFYNIACDYYYGLKTVDWNKDQFEEVTYVREYMKNRGFSAKALNEVKAKITFNKSYSIIFPMLDNGKFRGWVCRTTDKEVEKKRKYLYNEGFSRATTLVGDYGNKDFVFVVEGFMDRLKFIQFGEKNVVAILGWKMSDQQIKKLKSKGIKTIICALDNDECGIKGYEYLKKYFNVIRFAYIKGIKDPGEMDEKMFKKMYKRTLEKLK